jgi:hypothetical protein
MDDPLPFLQFSPPLILLPQLIQQEILISPTIHQLQSQTSPSHNQSSVNNIINSSPTITTILCMVKDLQQHPCNMSSTTSLTGFHHPKSKNFHVSHLLKLLDTVTLASDSLQDLETFHDTIHSHFTTISISSNIFSSNKNLKPSFTFHEHLCLLTIKRSLTSGDIQQALLNYTTFGSGLHQFILNPKTISQTTSPDSYLQLLPLQHETDGFIGAGYGTMAPLLVLCRCVPSYVLSYRVSR